MASDGRPPGKVLPSDLGADQAWSGGFRYPDPLGCWTEYYRLPCHLSGSVVRHHRLVRSPEDEKEYHNKILRKLKQGRRLTTAEKNYLQIHDPEMYKVALRVEMCRKRFTEQAKHCKSKEEFQTLVSNNMSVSDKDPMKEYIQAAISYEAQNIRKTPQYAALPDTNRKAEEKRTKGKKIKIDEDKEKDNDKKTAPLPSENYGSDLKTLSAVLTTKPVFDNFSN